jgi:hypothetical protein
MTTVDNLQKLGNFFPEEYQNLVNNSSYKKRKIGNVRKVRQLGKDYSNESLGTKYWKLTTMSGGEAYQQIKELTDMKIKDPNFSMEDMGSRLLRNDTISRGFMYAPTDENITRRVIGENGYFFKITTEYTGINFMWHDRSKNIFYFWGHQQNVVNAMNKIYERCVNQTKIVNEITTKP